MYLLETTTIVFSSWPKLQDREIVYNRSLLGEPLGKYHKEFHVTPDDGLISRDIYILSGFIVSML